MLSAADPGKFLVELRAERNLTQEELASELGISRRYLYEIESRSPVCTPTGFPACYASSARD